MIYICLEANSFKRVFILASIYIRMSILLVTENDRCQFSFSFFPVRCITANKFITSSEFFPHLSLSFF